MNITELARNLKITPKELKDYLPQFGYDIGARAIKLNKNVANKIIREWPKMKRKIEKQKEEKELAEKIKKEKFEVKKKIKIPNVILVKEYAALLGVPVNIILGELMKNGVFASLNERIDFDTAWLIGGDLGFEVERKDENEEIIEEGNKLIEILAKEDEKNLLARPPVIVVMGHVDHGKTKLLDAIRRANIAEGEAGGITQHIGAYQVERRNQLITFIDTPGHEAFTAMRSRGARIADVAILVVAADDGVKPQTIEAHKIISSAKIPFVVAINKIDKPDANIEKTKQELVNKLNVVPEDWGGKITCVPVSAKNNTGIVELLDMILLTAETAGDFIKANPNAKAVGTVIESNLSKASGPVATILIQNGTIRIGDNLMLDNFNVGKIRALNDHLENKIEKAGPATPVQIIGLKMMPKVGDIIEVGDGEKIKYKKMKNVGGVGIPFQSEGAEDDSKVQKINLIIKSDVLGSAEAIEESLEKINTKEVKAKIIHRGLGNISDGDVKRAEATGSVIVGFNVKISPAIEEIAREKKVLIKTYSIIYDLLKEVKEEMQKLVKPTYERVDLGRLKVLAIFRTEKDRQIVGGKVLDGTVEAESKIEIMRNKELVGTGDLLNLQSGKQDVSFVEADEECGLQYRGNILIEEGDVLQFYKNKEIKVVL